MVEREPQAHLAKVRCTLQPTRRLTSPLDDDQGNPDQENQHGSRNHQFDERETM